MMKKIPLISLMIALFWLGAAAAQVESRCEYWLRAERSDFWVPENRNPTSSPTFIAKKQNKPFDGGFIQCLKAAWSLHSDLGNPARQDLKYGAIEFVFTLDERIVTGWILKDTKGRSTKVVDPKYLSSAMSELITTAFLEYAEQEGFSSIAGGTYFSMLWEFGEDEALVEATVRPVEKPRS